MARVKQKKKTGGRLRVRGFTVAHGFTPYGFSTRITPPYFETSNGALAVAIDKAKGTQELSPEAMENYKAHLGAINPKRMAAELAKAAQADQAAELTARELAAEASASANTKADAAQAKADAAKAKLEELGDDSDLFTDDDQADKEDAGSGLKVEDLDGMTDAELLGVLKQFDIDPPARDQSRAVILPIAQQAVAGKLKPTAPAE